MDQDLLKLLENVGFTEKEAKVYLALLELVNGDVGEIAKIAGLKRPIIYIILEGLVKRGYVSQLPNTKVNKFQALDPSIILNQLRATTKNFSEMLPMLRTLHNEGRIKPRISYVEDKEGIWNIYQGFNFAKEAYFISSYVDIEKLFPKEIEKWVEYYKKGIIAVKGKHLIPNNSEEVKYGKMLEESKQSVRILKSAKKYKMDFTLCENKLAITSFENEPFMVVVESEELVKSMKPLFEIIWMSGKELPNSN